MQSDQHEANEKKQTDILDLYQSSDIFSGLIRCSVVGRKLWARLQRWGDLVRCRLLQSLRRRN